MTNLLCVSAYSHSGSKFIDHVLSVFLDQLLDLLSIQAFSEPGTPEYRKEQGTYMHFRELLEEIEGKHTRRWGGTN